MGAGRGDPAGGAVRGVVRQPAQVRPDRAPGGHADAGADRHRRPVRRPASARRRRTRRPPRRRWSPRRRCSARPASSRPGAWASWSRRPRCWPASRCPAGSRVAIVSNAGGAGVLAADACADSGLAVAPLGAATRRRLRGLLPAGAAVAGPVDTTAAVTAEAFRACLEQVAADDGVDAVLAVTVPTAIADLTRRDDRRGRRPSRWPPPCWTRPSSVRVPADSREAGPGQADARARGAGLRLPRECRPRARSRGPLPGLARPSGTARSPSWPGCDPAGAATLVAGFLAGHPGRRLAAGRPTPAGCWPATRSR